MAFLITENLTKKYGEGESEVIALDHVSLTVDRGEFLAVMGASGSGKSTLLNLLGGLDEPTEGKVLYDGKNLFDMDDEALSLFRLKTIGFVFQSYNLVAELNVRENILLPKDIAREKPDERQLSKIVEILELSDRLDHLPAQLSGGQQQRVAIARALINQPELLLCDEPTGNLDRQSGENVMQLLDMLNHDYGITIIMITHDPTLARRAMRTVRISDGRLLQS